MKGRISTIALSAAALCLACAAAQSTRADGIDNVTISLSAISGAPGSTVDVMGTITNSGPDTLDLDSDNTSTSFPLTLNDEFLNNAPFTLDGGTSATFEFFTITIDPTATPGVYGTDDSDVFSFFGDFNGVSVEDDVYFTADVTSLVVPAPEPSGLLLLGCGLLSLALLGKRKRLGGGKAWS